MITMMTLAILSGLVAGGVMWFAWGLLENINAFRKQRRWVRAMGKDAPDEVENMDSMEPEDVDAA
ncbi:MAG: hypothetical protein IID08_06460 [Candidatus Hydrogenedentes bacterium]|nr:hypothetical protein [Candidatus Hydrogenedentota bacterium]